MTVVKTCTCTHESQDQIHGKKQRVFNSLEKDNQYKCTVCGTIKK